jgi:hypothetical protein
LGKENQPETLLFYFIFFFTLHFYFFSSSFNFLQSFQHQALVVVGVHS